MKFRSRLLGVAVSALLVGSLLPVAAQAAPVEVEPVPTDTSVSTESSMQLRSINKCTTYRKTNLIIGYTFSPSHPSSYNDCWLAYEKLEVRKYNVGTQMLQRHGLGLTGAAADGYFGEDTLDAVIKAQKAWHAEPDGVYGWNTGKAIKWKNQNGKWFKWS